jgi:hypothetical protein
MEEDAGQVDEAATAQDRIVEWSSCGDGGMAYLPSSVMAPCADNIVLCTTLTRQYPYTAPRSSDCECNTQVNLSRLRLSFKPQYASQIQATSNMEPEDHDGPNLTPYLQLLQVQTWPTVTLLRRSLAPTTALSLARCRTR